MWPLGWGFGNPFPNIFKKYISFMKKVHFGLLVVILLLNNGNVIPEVYAYDN